MITSEPYHNIAVSGESLLIWTAPNKNNNNLPIIKVEIDTVQEWEILLII